MNTGYWMGYILAGLVWAITWGVAARAIVINKGYDFDGNKFFWLGFFFSFIPVIVAATKPQYQKQALETRTPSEDRLDKQSSVLSLGGWKCSCGRVNYSYVTTCPCGKNKRDVLSQQQQTEENEKPSQKDAVKQAEQSIPAQIREYKELFDAGILTQEEYEAKKKQLLNL